MEHGPDDFVGVPEDGGPSIPLTRDNVIVYKLSEYAIAKRLCEALDLRFHLDRNAHPRSGQLIGFFDAYAGRSYPAYVLIAGCPAEFERAIHQLLLAQKDRFILLLPTIRQLLPKVNALLDERKIVVMVLSNSVDVAGSTWVATRLAKDALLSLKSTDDTGKRVPKFPTPYGATWKNVFVNFIDARTLEISVGEIVRRYSAADLDLDDGRNNSTKMAWRLLLNIARPPVKGSVPNPESCKELRKHREELNRVFVDLLGLQQEPVSCKGGAWHTLFELAPYAQPDEGQAAITGQSKRSSIVPLWQV